MQLHELEYSPIKDRNLDISISSNGLSFLHSADHYEISPKYQNNSAFQRSYIQKISAIVNIMAKTTQRVQLKQKFEAFYKVKVMYRRLKRNFKQSSEQQSRKNNIKRLISALNKIQDKNSRIKGKKSTNLNSNLMNFESKFKQKFKEATSWAFRQLKTFIKPKNSISSFKQSAQVRLIKQQNSKRYNQILEILGMKKPLLKQTARFQQQISQDQLFILTDQSKSLDKKLDLLSTKRVTTQNQKYLYDKTNLQIFKTNDTQPNSNYKLQLNEISFQKQNIKSPQIKVNKFQVYFTQEILENSETSRNYGYNLQNRKSNSQFKLTTMKKPFKQSFLQQKFKKKNNQKSMRNSVFDCSECEYCIRIKQMKKVNYRIVTKQL